MTISEIYSKYNIPQNLQEHMLRVAAVGSIVVDFLNESVLLDKSVIISALLLHDMGNILKYDFSDHIAFDANEILRLKELQKEFILKYGASAHVATTKIAREIGVSEEIIYILENSGSSKVADIVKGENWHRKVCAYADFRVAPYGVVGVNDRFNDIVKRYKGRNHPLADVVKTEEKRANALLLEKQIQEKSKKNLSLIDDVMIKGAFEELKNYSI
ncbi:MAG: HD domain-containing protein [Patescibacteria group bacterium]